MYWIVKRLTISLISETSSLQFINEVKIWNLHTRTEPRQLIFWACQQHQPWPWVYVLTYSVERGMGIWNFKPFRLKFFRISRQNEEFLGKNLSISFFVYLRGFLENFFFIVGWFFNFSPPMNIWNFVLEYNIHPCNLITIHLQSTVLQNKICTVIQCIIICLHSVTTHETIRIE